MRGHCKVNVCIGNAQVEDASRTLAPVKFLYNRAWGSEELCYRFYPGHHDKGSPDAAARNRIITIILFFAKIAVISCHGNWEVMAAILCVRAVVLWAQKRRVFCWARWLTSLGTEAKQKFAPVLFCRAARRKVCRTRIDG